jgi:hypothetical protein
VNELFSMNYEWCCNLSCKRTAFRSSRSSGIPSSLCEALWKSRCLNTCDSISGSPVLTASWQTERKTLFSWDCIYRKHAISHREEGRMFLNNPFSREIWKRFSHHSILSCLLCWHLHDDLAIFSHILYDPKTQQHVALFYHTDQDIQYRSTL